VIDTALPSGQDLPLTPSSGPPAGPRWESRSLNADGWPRTAAEASRKGRTRPGSAARASAQATETWLTLTGPNRPSSARIRQHPPWRAPLPGLTTTSPILDSRPWKAYLGPRPVFTNLRPAATNQGEQHRDPRAERVGRVALIQAAVPRNLPGGQAGILAAPLPAPDGDLWILRARIGLVSPGSARPTIEAACWPAMCALRLSSAPVGIGPSQQPTAAHRLEGG